MTKYSSRNIFGIPLSPWKVQKLERSGWFTRYFCHGQTIRERTSEEPVGNILSVAQRDGKISVYALLWATFSIERRPLLQFIDCYAPIPGARTVRKALTGAGGIVTYHVNDPLPEGFLPLRFLTYVCYYNGKEVIVEANSPHHARTLAMPLFGLTSISLIIARRKHFGAKRQLELELVHGSIERLALDQR